MRFNTDHAATTLALLTAKAKGLPVTISYLKEEKDEVTGKKTGRMVETIRTIEIYDECTTKAGNQTFKAMDREAAADENDERGGARTWRLDRIVAYTVHRTSRYAVEIPEDIAEKLAEAAATTPVTVEEAVERELEKDIDAPAVENLTELDPSTGNQDHVMAAITALLAA